MADVLLVHNTQLEGSGYLGDLLQQDGFEIDSVHARYDRLPDSEYSLIVILGAPDSANDHLRHLRDEEQLIRKNTDNNVPVLGICLGSQLIARAFGAKVYRGPIKEIGFYSDLRANPDSGLFNGFKDMFTVFHWHGDTFDLPEGARRLAYSGKYQNQAFQIRSAVGLQFHLEINEEMINMWLDRSEERLRQIPYIDPQKIRSDIGEKISEVQANMDTFYANFKSSFNL